MNGRSCTDGLGTSERKILDLWDAGMGSRRIAARVGLRHARVLQVIRIYCGRDEQADSNTGIAAGSAALLAQLRTLQRAPQTVTAERIGR